LPIPYEQIKDKLKPGVRYLLWYGMISGELSFTPYLTHIIGNNLTDVGDFEDQFNHLKDRLGAEANLNNVEFFLLNFPYYPEVGYLFDKEDLNFYLGKHSYTINNSKEFGAEDRVSLLTFICMYALLLENEIHGFDDILVNDGLVLSEVEREGIKLRIDEFNRVISGATSGHVHLIDIGSELNELFTTGLGVGDKTLSRHWGRGNAFSLDGVHANYTVHAHMANIILSRMNAELGLSAQTYDLPTVLANDPYVDGDGDGWVSGPTYKASGRTRILFLFKDINEGVSGDAVIDSMTPSEVWELISDALLEEIIDIPLIQMEAERIGLIPIK
jgi:hypothetical protein